MVNGGLPAALDCPRRLQRVGGEFAARPAASPQASANPRPPPRGQV